MKKIILGIVLIAISGVIAWNGAEWADGQDLRHVWLIFVVCFSFFGGVFSLIGSAMDYLYNC